MKKTFAIILVSSALAACDDGAAPAPAPDVELGDTVPASSARTVAGDVVPVALAPAALQARAPDQTLRGSDPVAPYDAFDVAIPAPVSRSRAFQRLVAPGSTQTTRLPIDAPLGATVIVTAAADPGREDVLTGVHLVAADGLRLDGARDKAPLAPEVARTRVDQAKGDVREVAKTEPAMAVLALPRRALTINEDIPAGVVALEVSNDVRAAGYAVEITQPDTTIEAVAAAGQGVYVSGQTAHVRVEVMDASTRVADVAGTAWVELPDGSRLDGVPVTVGADGAMDVALVLDDTDPRHVGLWIVHATVAGRSDGRAFERSIDATFGYVRSYARMVAAHAPRILRTGGQVTAVEIDVDVESAVAARLGLRGTFVVVGADGAEHAVAAAQTGQDVAAGQAVITLRFDGGALGLAGLDGPFLLRDLALISHSDATTQHRLGRGLELRTPVITAAELPAIERTPAIEESLDLGTL